MYKKFLKRLIDLVSATLGFVILMPVFVIIAIVLWIVTRSSPFFVQVRPGKDSIPFDLIKFKTMDNRRDNEGNYLPDAQRLTSFGKFLRKTSLDEIPQLLNVIRGDMSLIGPRPLLMEYMELYSKAQRRRHEVRPGITGWAQVNGRNAIGWDEKFLYDLWYVDNLSFGLDLKILLKTIHKVVKADGISAEGHATMPTFNEYVKKLKEEKNE